MGPLPRASLLAAILVLAFTWPALDVGFLADDFHTGHRIALAAEEAPGPWGAVSSAFSQRWTEEFDVFRPLTILTIQLDYALFGAEGRLHHITSLVLWVLAAMAFASVAARLGAADGPVARGFAMALFGVWPAAVEALGWLVAREDVLLTLFVLLTVRGFTSDPDRPGRWCLPMILAFLCKETAVVLPPLLIWIDLLRGGRLRRHFPSLALLGIYFLVRFLLFGRVGMTYSGVSYWDHLGRDGSLQQIGASLASGISSLAVPVNDYALARLVPHPMTGIGLVIFLLPLVALVLDRITDGSERNFRTSVIAAGWIIGPLLIVSPILQVGPGLDCGRTLLLPGAGFLLLLCSAVSAAERRRPRLATAIRCWLVLAGGCAMVMNLGAWTAASSRAEGLLDDLRGLPADKEVIFVGAGFSTTTMPQELIIHEGAWVLSAGLLPALQAPFREPPAGGVRLLGWRELEACDAADLERLASRQPQLVALRPGAERPSFVLLGSQEPQGRLPGKITAGEGFRLQGQLRVSSIGRTGGLSLEVTLCDLEGNRAVAARPAPEPRDGLVSWALGGQEFEPPLTPGVLEALASPLALAWVEVYRGDEHVGATGYSLVRLPRTP